MKLKTIISTWLFAWIALVPVGLLKMGGYGAPIEWHILGAVTFALPLTAPAVLAAMVGLWARRDDPNVARRLATCWAIATTFWAGTSVTAMNGIDHSFLNLTEGARQALILGFFAASASLLSMIDAYIYFAEARLGFRRLALSGSCIVSLVVTLVALLVFGSGGDLSFNLILLTGELGLMTGLVTLLLALATMIANRWVRSGFAADRKDTNGAISAG